MNPLKLFLALSATHCVQRMQYYPSGLPWSDVMGTSEQLYKYNDCYLSHLRLIIQNSYLPFGSNDYSQSEFT